MPCVVKDLVILPLGFHCAIDGGTSSSLLGPTYTTLFLEAEVKIGVTLNVLFFFFPGYLLYK